MDELKKKPNAIVADQYFHETKFLKFYDYYHISPIDLGPNTPWPNRAEAAVKVVKATCEILLEHVKTYETLDPNLKNVTIDQVVAAAVGAPIAVAGPAAVQQ